MVKIGDLNRIDGTNAIGAGASARGPKLPTRQPPEPPPEPPPKRGWRLIGAGLVAVIVFLAALFGAASDGLSVFDRVMAWIDPERTAESEVLQEQSPNAITPEPAPPDVQARSESE